MNQQIIDLTKKVQEQYKNLDRLTFTIKEAAQVLGIGQNKMRELIRCKDGVPHIKVGARILIPIKSFEIWIDNSINNHF